MDRDLSTNPVPCATCGAPLEPDAVCLACAFDSALTSGSGGPGEESPTASQSGFGDFTPSTGSTFGKYRLDKELGSGGMGLIWEAEDTRLQRTVAIKMIRGSAFSSAGERQRFQREATMVARLDHPNIVPIYEVGEIGGQPYFAMKRLAGGPLSAQLANGAMDQREAAVIMEKLARAIAHAHERGVLHRDLKPGNVLFDKAGEPHMTDFGLAKLLNEGDALTLTTAQVGTPHYMSPEQARGRAKDITAASDNWGAGALLFHMLTGHTPFDGESSGEILHHVAHDKPRSMEGAVPAVDKELRTLCLRCLERDPEQRLPSAEVLADELARWLDGRPIATRPTSPATRAWRWIGHRPVHAAAIAIAIALLLIIIVAAVGSPRRQGGGTSINPIPNGDRVLNYGDTISLRNLSSGEFLDTCGHVSDSDLAGALPTQSLFVFTSQILNRGGRPTGTWQIESPAGHAPSTPLSFGTPIHLRSLYPGGGWLDNCGLLKHLPTYLDFAADQQAAVSTSMKHPPDDGTDTWIIRSPHGKSGQLEAGDAIILETAFAGGGHLNASGAAAGIAAFKRLEFEGMSALVFVSNRESAAGPSGQWKVERTDGRAPKQSEKSFTLSLSSRHRIRGDGQGTAQEP